MTNSLEYWNVCTIPHIFVSFVHVSWISVVQCMYLPKQFTSQMTCSAVWVSFLCLSPNHRSIFPGSDEMCGGKKVFFFSADILSDFRRDRSHLQPWLCKQETTKCWEPRTHTDRLTTTITVRKTTIDSFCKVTLFADVKKLA